MQKKLLFGSIIIIALFLLSSMGDFKAQAGTKDMTATKRKKYTDDSVESMRDVFARREVEEEEYRKAMLLNSSQTVALLAQVRDLLIQLNAKK